MCCYKTGFYIKRWVVADIARAIQYKTRVRIPDPYACVEVKVKHSRLLDRALVAMQRSDKAGRLLLKIALSAVKKPRS